MIGRTEAALTCGLLFLLGTWVGGAGAQDSAAGPGAGAETYTIAVLSPSDGPLRDPGRLHDESVRRVFGLGTGNTTVIEGRTVRVLFRGTGDPVESTGACVEEARRAVDVDQAIAILGPVASGCTSRVLDLGLRVPVLSSLSTARSLDDPAGWFFRTIAHDQRRLETFVDTARGRGLAIDSSVVVYEPSAYGEGLLEHLRERITSVDSDHVFAWDDVFDAAAHEIGVKDSFRHEMDDHQHAVRAVFVLASSDRMIAHVQALDDMFESLGDPQNDPDFVLVGSTQPARDLPGGTWMIAEAQVGTSRNLVTELETQTPPPADDLYTSSLDAAIALRGALREAFRRAGPDSLAPGPLRRRLRRTLAERTFASSERYRTIDFVEGEINPPPDVPIYRVSVEERRRVESLNVGARESWVQLSVRERPEGHFEGPVVVELTPHGEDLIGQEVVLEVGGVADEPVEVERVRLTRAGASVRFTPSFLGDRWFPASFWIGTDQTPIQERVEIRELGWPASYVVALLAALFGAVLYARYRTTGDGAGAPEGEGGEAAGGGRRRRALRYVERCVAGLVIAFLIIHVAPTLEGEPLLSKIPIPQFGASLWFNAFVSGLLGGWLGLNPIMGLAAAVVGTLTPIFSSEA